MPKLVFIPQIQLFHIEKHYQINQLLILIHSKNIVMVNFNILIYLSNSTNNDINNI